MLNYTKHRLYENYLIYQFSVVCLEFIEFYVNCIGCNIVPHTTTLITFNGGGSGTRELAG